MECRFYVGQRIVCVDTSPGPPKHVTGLTLDGLTEGRVYTIAKLEIPPPIFKDMGWVDDSIVWVHLVEIVREPAAADTWSPGVVVGYRHTRFRPATDISSLEALLRTAKPPVGKKEPA